MASPGDAIPVTVAGLPLILLRDENGCIRGFHNVCRGDARGQAVYILDKIKAGVMSLGGSLSDIVRTRVYLQNAKDCEAVSLVHGRYFGEVCPANATFEISQLIDDYLVEIEAEAIVEE
jgi:enamine deaminase RidA (YjgF/YER057c/UK114 family)